MSLETMTQLVSHTENATSFEHKTTFTYFRGEIMMTNNLNASNMNLRIGVLVIGSLIWDGSDTRQKWRQAKLRICDRVHVKVPIRYGRKSGSRGHTYTMVFSKDMDCQKKMGTGIAVPCARNVRCSADLIDEAEALWVAERPAAGDNEISANWGCVGIICNPKLEQEDDNDIIKIKEAWSNRVKLEAKKHSDSLYKAGNRAEIGEGGILNIDWPKTETGEAYDGADILLATANEPDDSYPSPKTIARAWKRDKRDRIRYFYDNQEWGIRTSEDDEIKKSL